MSTNIFHDTSCVMENVSSVSSVMENVNFRSYDYG